MNDEIIVNVWETGVTPEDVLERSHNGMAPRKEHDLLPWKTDAEIYNPAELEEIEIVTPAPTLLVGDFQRLYVKQTPDLANLPELCWESSDVTVARVNQDGVVFAHSEGEATITVSKPNSEFSDSVLVTVTASEEEPEPAEKKEPGLAWSAESVTVTSAEDQLPTLTNPNNLTVTYSSSVEGVATVSEEGVVTLVDSGETVITASFAGNEEYKEGTASYTLTYNKQ